MKIDASLLSWAAEQATALLAGRLLNWYNRDEKIENLIEIVFLL